MSAHFEATTGLIHLYDEGMSYARMDRYRAVLNLLFPAPDMAVVTGTQGEIRPHDLRDIGQLLHKRGVATLYLRRAPGHRMPYATREGAGPFRGWWRIRIEEHL